MIFYRELLLLPVGSDCRHFPAWRQLALIANNLSRPNLPLAS